jgi:hypothetical protein
LVGLVVSVVASVVEAVIRRGPGSGAA